MEEEAGMSDLERLVLEKHDLLRQRGELVAIIAALIRTHHGKARRTTIRKTVFVAEDRVQIRTLESGSVEVRLLPPLKPSPDVAEPRNERKVPGDAPA